MLSIPTGGGTGLALHLCQTQNRALDLSRLSRIDTRVSSHHSSDTHHASDHTGKKHTALFSPDCRGWLASASVGFMAALPASIAYLPVIIPPARLDADLPGHPRRSNPEVRAPPTLVS